MRSADLQRVLINLIRQVDSGSVEFIPGQIISVVLRQVRGNSAVINYLGKNIPARLETEVPEGARLNCRVEMENGNQIVLKVLDKKIEGLSTQDVRSIAGRLGLTDSPAASAVVREMVRQEMPLVRETARLITAFAGSAEVPEEDLWIPVQMQKLGIPLRRQNYDNVKQLVRTVDYLSADIEKMSGLIEKFIKTIPQNDPLRQLGDDIKRALDPFRLNSGDKAGSVAIKLAQAFKQLTNAMAAVKPAAVTDLTSLLKKLAGSISDFRGPESRELLQAANSLLEKLEVLQQVNKAEANREQVIFIYSTVQFEDKGEPLRLAVSYRNNRRDNKRDLTKCRVEIKLHTPRLGLVKCDLEVDQRNLTLRFYAGDKTAAKVIDSHRENLTRRLEKMNFQVKMMGCHIDSPKSETLFNQSQLDVPELFRVNLRV